MRLPIYLDYMATTPVDPRVIERMLAFLGPESEFGNPASMTHRYGLRASEAVDQARQCVAAVLNADSEEIIWTSGGTEANNLALKGAARFYQRQGKHIITCQTEHKAVLDPCLQLEREGFSVTYLPPDENGLLPVERLEAALRSDTILVSIMHANNETGVIQDIQAMAELTRSRGILFHTDAIQSAGKIPLDVKKTPVDMISLSAHKIYGPKGIGALYIRRKPRLRLEPLAQGGGQEQGLRPGTLPTHQIVGMGEAFRLASLEMAMENERLLLLRQRLWSGLRQLPHVYLNGDADRRLSGNLNISIGGLEASELVKALQPYVAFSTGSACASGNLTPSHVLLAMGMSEARARQAFRLSMGRFTTEPEIDFVLEHLVRALP